MDKIELEIIVFLERKRMICKLEDEGREKGSDG